MRRVLLAASLGLALSGCGSDPGPPSEFLVAVGDETFAMRASRPEVARLAHDNFLGRNSRFPIGPLLPGDGGFNAPWSWHLDPDRVDMTELAIEVCDGQPSYVEAHRADFEATGYCPWAARVVAIRR
jgi:tagatose-1,6-bisphosphate aldolase non-catalytic subunit AgaZ/GatZ